MAESIRVYMDPHSFDWSCILIWLDLRQFDWVCTNLTGFTHWVYINLTGFWTKQPYQLLHLLLLLLLWLLFMLLICHYLPYQSSWLMLPQYHRNTLSNCHIINNNHNYSNNHSNNMNGNQWHICTLTLSVWLCTFFWVLLTSSPPLLCFTSPLLLRYYQLSINIVVFIVSSKLTISTSTHLLTYIVMLL